MPVPESYPGKITKANYTSLAAQSNATETAVAKKLDTTTASATYPTLVNVLGYGATGDGSTDDTAAIQAAITAVEAVGGGTVYLPRGTFVITSALAVGRGGVRLAGASRRRTIIKQTSASANAVTVNRDTAALAGETETFTRGFVIEDVRLEGPGIVTGTTFSGSTGVGVQATDGATYGGQFIDLRSVTIKGFDVGVRLTRWDNCYAKVLLDRCRVGWHSDGNGNSHKIVVSGTNCTETCLRFGDGSAVEVSAQDIISCGVMIDCLDQSQVNLSGANFESCMGTEAFIKLANGARMTASPGRFIKGIGQDVPGFLVQNGASLVLLTHPNWSGFTTAKTIRKASTSAVVQGIAPTRNFSVAPEVTVDEGGLDSYGVTMFATRQENSVPTASINLRGMLLWAMGRTASAATDVLHAYLRHSDGVSRRHILTGKTAFGAATLAAGTVTVAQTVTTAASVILLTPQAGAGTGVVSVTTRTAGTGFTITSSDAADTRKIGYVIYEP